MDDIRTLDVNTDLIKASSFETKDHKYKIIKRTDLSIDRTHHLHGYIEQITRATRKKPINQILTQIKLYIQQRDDYSLSNYVAQQLESNELYTHQGEFTLKACATFIVREDEDVKKYQPELTDEKIKDWTDNGMSENAFFFLLLMYSMELAKIWNYFFRSISEANNEDITKAVKEANESLSD